MAIKIAFIGAGSVGFTRRLMADILTVPELRDTHFAFTDISKQNLDMVTQLCRRDLKANKAPAKLTATTSRRRAVADANYVFNVTRIGGLEAFQHDIDVPLKYGVDQCVGDTICAGGIMYGQRNIPQILTFIRDMKDVSADDCLFMNYANPMAMNTWAALDAYDRGEGVRTVGLCHGVEGGWSQIGAALGAKDYREEVQIICAGINHQTWYVQVIYKGRKIGSKELLRAFEKHKDLMRSEKVRIDVLRRFGYYSTESNGHLSEYLPWYRKRPKEIRKWIDTGSWINGETGGYLRLCLESRGWFKTDFPRWLAEPPFEYKPEARSREHGSYIIESLETGRCYRGHFNVRNGGTITNLPPDCIIEAPGYVDGNGMNIPIVGDLPMACAATCNASINMQRMSKEAAVTGDVMLLKQAMLHDPLVGAVCNPEEVWQMTDEMLIAQAKWLPQYRKEVPKARRRLAGAKRLGTWKWKGAARVRVKSIDELRREADKSVLAADKAVDREKAPKRKRSSKKRRKSA